MRRLLRQLPAELVSIFLKPVGTYLDLSLVVIPDEVDFLNITIESHLLHLFPFYLLRIRPAISLPKEQHPQDDSYQEQVKP